MFSLKCTNQLEIKILFCICLIPHSFLPWQGLNDIVSFDVFFSPAQFGGGNYVSKFACYVCIVVYYICITKFFPGGAVLEDGDGIDLVQCYNPRTDMWIDRPTMQIPRSGSASCVLDGLIYVIGIITLFYIIIGIQLV